MHTKKARPLVSVVIVHSHGKHLLAELLPALLDQTYEPIEILLVDNASTDGSLDYVRQNFEHVKLIASTANLGFCGGNNLGIRAACGAYVALLNNDTVPEESWLAHLVAEAESSADIGAVASKILFLKPFVPVTLTIDTFNPAATASSLDSRELGVLFDETSAFAESHYDKRFFQDGFLGPERIGERTVRWTRRNATVLLPIANPKQAANLTLLVSGGDLGSGRGLTIGVGATALESFELTSDFQERRIKVPSEVIGAEAFDVINNAGSFLSRSGVAGDRGIYEPDCGQYDSAEDVEAICGASVLFRRRALQDVGVFDPDFFMYYEDTDLSWRLKKHGYRLRYQPKSVVRHVHAASSQAWSPMFNFYVARNKVLMIAKNGSFGDFLRAYGAELRFTLRLLRWQFRPSKQRPEGTSRQLLTRLRVQLSFLTKIPKALLKRWNLLAQ